MRFPARDLTDQYISSSYQDVLQQYIAGTTFYVLDGYGNVVFTIPSASLGNTVITSDVTSSMKVLSASYSQIIEVTRVSSSFASASISASYALTASYVSGSTNLSISSSYASTASIAIIANTAISSVTATYADTASISISSVYSDTSSLSAEAISASYARTASYIDSAAVIHNSLSGLQGGTNNQYYHLTAAEYAALQSGTASFAGTASYAMNGGSGGAVIDSGSSWNITASFATASISASYALTASYALNGGGGGGTVIESGSSWNITASWAFNALTASYLLAPIPSGSTATASYAYTASYLLNGGLNIPNYDYSYVEYLGPLNQFSRCTYRLGGISGSIVSIVDAYYSGSLFIGVSKSLG